MSLNIDFINLYTIINGINMNYKNEKTILKIIKFTPSLFIISMSIFLIIFLYYEYKTTYLEEEKSIEKEFIEYNKKIVKNNVETVYNSILDLQKNTELELKKSIKERVYEAYTIANSIYNENKDTKDKKTITKMIKDALVNIRFNEGRGYYYIYSFDYTCILFPLNRSMEGKNFYDYKDGKGNYLTRNIVKQLKENKEGFNTWYFNKPSDMKNNYKKIGFNIYFEPLDWFIGTGEYLDEFEDSIKIKAISYIKTLKYLNNNYIFVIDYDGTYLSHIKKEVVGKSGVTPDGANDIKDGEEIVLDAIHLAKVHGEGYLSYVQNKKLINGDATKKTSYVKGIQNWNWLIGQGFYEDDYKIALEKKRIALKDKFLSYMFNIFLLSIFLMVVLLLISEYISKLLQKKFKDYQCDIEEFMNENNHQRDILAHQSKMSAMGEMIGNIAHQWRQPLSVITTAASGVKLNKELGILDDKSLNDSMDIVVEQSLYLSHIIEEFKGFLTSSHERTFFSVEKAVNSAIQLAYGKFENKNIIIIKKIDDIHMDNFENQLIQVLINILKNAEENFKKDQEKIIIISSYIKDSDVYISIHDNAGGIPEKNISRIFEPYFTTKHQYHGTGMGLYMSEELVTKAMNGVLSVTNSEFKHNGQIYMGANFLIKLPLEIKKS